MLPDSLHHVPGICQEHPVVVWIWAVGWIRQPEILPYDYAILIAGIVEFHVACLPYPVADHIEIHFFVQRERSVIFLCPKPQVKLAESPISALRREAMAVYEHL